VFAHSFGTFVLAQVLLRNPRFKFDRVILCGSIVPDSFHWDRVQNQILSTGDKRDAIINECGILDVWPVLASSATWGYGATGTYGFGVHNVRDRYHAFRHSDFFNSDFILSNWVPAVQGLPIDFSKTDIAPDVATPKLFNYFRFPLRWIIFVALPIVVVVAIWGLSTLAANRWCPTGTVRSGKVCINKSELVRLEEVDSTIARLLVIARQDVGQKGNLLRLLQLYAPPDPRAWDRIRGEANKVQSYANEVLERINEYNARTYKIGDKVMFRTVDGKAVSIDRDYWNLFEEIKDEFERKGDVLSLIYQTTQPPGEREVTQWIRQLRDLERKLEDVCASLMAGIRTRDDR
jgi:hypothetical protein